MRPSGRGAVASLPISLGSSSPSPLTVPRCAPTLVSGPRSGRKEAGLGSSEQAASLQKLEEAERRTHKGPPTLHLHSLLPIQMGVLWFSMLISFSSLELSCAILAGGVAELNLTAWKEMCLCFCKKNQCLPFLIYEHNKPGSTGERGAADAPKKKKRHNIYNAASET